MSPNGISSGFDETLIFSSDSSDSEFLLHEDVKTRGNEINKQWEAIERTLFQEPGQQVTDPELLKECKLWRETFPHFRVKGTKIDVNKSEDEVGEAEKNIQTLQNHFNLKVLEEKRESIKKKVVGVLVERIIAKFGSEKRESAKSERSYSSGVQITEIDDETADNMSKWSSGGLKQVENSIMTAVGTEKESYFERGKPLDPKICPDDPEDEDLTVEQVEKKLCEIFGSWEKDANTATKLPETAASPNSRKIAISTRKNVILSSDKSTTERFKPHKVPPSNSLSGIIRPFEMTKKIDKKYERLIEKIIERQHNGLDARIHCRRTSSSRLESSYQDSLAKLRMESGFDEHKRNINMPRLNKFSNNWLERSELDTNNRSAGDTFLDRPYKSNKASKGLYTENISQREIDERFLEELKREMALNYKRPPKKSGIVEEISLRRPKPFRSTPKMTINSSSFGDLTKRNKKEIKGVSPKRGLESGKKESNIKSRVKSSNSNGSKGNKLNGTQNSLLPPIETGIICTELTGRPKIGPKNPTKRFY